MSTSVYKSAFYHIRNLFLNEEISIYGMYWNSCACFCQFTTGLQQLVASCSPKHILQKLQYAQNAAARLIKLSRKYDHITPHLMELHWLPIEYRIQFKIILLNYKALNGLAPSYVSDLLQRYTVL